MEDVKVWLFWLVVVGVGIANSIIKARKKAQQNTKPRRKSLVDVLGELSGDTTSVSESNENEWPVMAPEGDQTPFGGYSFDTGEGMMDDRSMRGETNSEIAGYDVEAEFVDEIAYYERLAAERAHRTTYGGKTHDNTRSGQTHDSTHSGQPHGSTRAETTTKECQLSVTEPVAISANLSTTDPDATTSVDVGEFFADGFDLRRAVIEAEILTPKYIR